MTGGLARLGTTLTSYVFIWETIGAGIEEPPRPAADGGAQKQAGADAVIGAVFTAVILWFMLVAAAATLGRHHQAVTSAQGAARILRPLAGPVAADLSAAGLVTLAVVALSVSWPTSGRRRARWSIPATITTRSCHQPTGT